MFLFLLQDLANESPFPKYQDFVDAKLAIP